MSIANIPIISFKKGLVTPHVDARADAESYQHSCRVLENFIARMYGSAERRPGTYYLNTMRDSDTPTTIEGVTTCLLVPFIYSRTVAYVLEFTGYYIRIYLDDAVVDEIDSPYAEADLFDLQFKQLGDVIWITHEDYTQRKFSRVDTAEFELELPEFRDGPFLKRNDLATRDGKQMTIAGTGLDLTESSTTTYGASENTTTAFRAYDNNSLSRWTCWGDGEAGWISVKWAAGKTIKRMRLLSKRLKQFKVQGSNEANPSSADSADWTDLDVDSWAGDCKAYQTTNVEVTTKLKTEEWVDITFTNVTDYLYYRLYVLDIYPRFGYYYARIYEIQYSDTKTPAADDDAVLTCSADHFESGHVGALFALTQPRVNASIAFEKSGTGTSDELLVEGTWTLSMETGWIAVVQLERKIKEDSKWEPIRQWTSYSKNRAVQISGVEDEDNAYYRVNVSTYTDGTVRGELTCNEANHTGICKVLEYTDEQNVKVLIIKDFVSEETTTRWAEGAWSEVRGYPTSCTFMEDRCVYGGMKSVGDMDANLATVWFSASGDYDTFKAGTKGSQSFSVTIETTETLQWIDAMYDLLVGTTGGIFFIRSSKMDTPLVPNPPPISRQISSYPCNRVKPVKLMKTMVYLSGRQVRELAYDRGSFQWDEDLTAICEQITSSPVANMAVQTNPDTILWCAHENGDMSIFVYDRENNVTAWAEMPMALTGGGVKPDIKSICVIPDSGSGDDVYVAVHRTILGYKVYDGDEQVYDGDEPVYDMIRNIFIEKFAKRFE